MSHAYNRTEQDVRSEPDCEKGSMNTNEKFDYFINRTERDFDAVNHQLQLIRDDFEKITDRLDNLTHFKSMLLGGSLVFSAISTLVMNYVFKKL